MPDKVKTAQVLEEYVATRSSDQNATTETIKNKFPEIKALAQAKGVTEEAVLENLNNYYTDYKSGNYKTLDDMNSDPKNSFFFGGVETSIGETSTVTTTTTDTEAIKQVEPGASSSLTADVLQEYVATRNSNQDLTDAEMMAKFPEIDSYSQSTGKTTDAVNESFTTGGWFKIDEFTSSRYFVAKYHSG